MDKSKFLALARKFNCVLFEDNGLRSGTLPLVVAGHTVGLVRAELLPLVGAASIFHVSESAVTLDPVLDTPAARSEAMAQLLERWRDQEDLVALRGWRNECYDVRVSFSSQPLLKMERSATSVFGIRQYGVDLNGYTRHPDKGLCVWIQRRSLQKPTWPGKLDNMVSGGLSSGLGLVEAMRKEAWEEAGIPDHLLSGLTSTGAVSFAYSRGTSTFASHAFCFDLELPAEFVPQPQDGEAEEFVLVTPQELMELVCSAEFKTTSAPVTLDFLVRHGFITPDNEPHYLEVCELLHVPLQVVYNTGRLFGGLRPV
ncbi:uncharacterized protein YJR142W-like isoform X2 [Pollicipes pollicipes]|uniref:uncharacterized protein YJR142W-like isoform X2 n=1 Tax=Pollicipes pollicipes TaxID=41117 RepID=UPI0018849649|nr:uncharacterized protein YJR142W-like isoform X2 [Pollicipes pollicipes]